ncbi:MAG: hypothetical protein MUQ30_05995 [Anaerolineae bacterium]|nr:hypothetical protein [Anaerolineae bacterium]
MTRFTASLYHSNLNQLTGPIDVLIGCGDLPYGCMDFIVTQPHVEHALCVHGNHDRPQSLPSGRRTDRPLGWINVDRRVIYLKKLDLLVAGLQGSTHYSAGDGCQYTEREMAYRALTVIPQLLPNRALRGRYVDVFIAHAPPKASTTAPKAHIRGSGPPCDSSSGLSRGLFLRGHHHRYGREIWHTQHQHTDIVNVHPFCMITYDGETVTVNNRRLQRLPGSGYRVA